MTHVDPSSLADTLAAESSCLRALAHSLLAQPADIDDVLQQTSLAALVRPPVSVASLKPWLTRVLRNFALRARRTERKVATRERRAARDEALPSTAEVVERVEIHRRLVSAVLALSEPYRETVLLRFWEQLPPREVAARMNVPVSTVRTRLLRAMTLLRTELDASDRDRDHGAWRTLLAPLVALPQAAAAAVTATTGTTVARAAVATAVASPAFSIGALMMSTKSWVTAAGLALAALSLVVWQVVSPTEPSLARSEEQGQALAQVHAGAGREPPAMGTPAEREAVPGATTTAVASLPKVAGRILDEDTEQPVRGATVRMFHMFVTEDGDVRAQSGADGRFEIAANHRTPGFFRDLAVEAEGYAPLAMSPRKPNPAQVASGSTSADTWDLGDLRMSRGALVTGTVVSVGGRPGVATAKLMLLPVAHQGGSFLRLHCASHVATSRVDGRFVLGTRVAPASGERGHLLFALGDEGIGWTTLQPIRGSRSSTS